MTPPLRISTARLDLVAATAVLARAAADDPARFAEILNARLPPSWPPSVLLDVQELFAAQLEKGAAIPGWWAWYAILREGALVVGSAGFAAPPDEIGTITLGYSIAGGYEGRGLASELVEGLLQWAAATGRVARVYATTFERHFASIRVLEKNGFVWRGISSEDAGASDEDRQGRGALMLYVREMRES